MKRLGIATAFLLLGACPALAQGIGGGIPLGQERQKTPDEIERAKATEDAYKKTLRTIPDAKASNDPWGNIRSEDKKAQPTPQPKAAKKTGSTTTN